MPYATSQRTTMVIYNSYTTQQLKNCINPEVQQGTVVFQLYYRLGDVVVDRRDQQTSYIIPAMKTTMRWQLVAGVDTFQSYISCGGKYGKPINKYSTTVRPRPWWAGLLLKKMYYPNVRYCLRQRWRSSRWPFHNYYCRLCSCFLVVFLWCSSSSVTRLFLQYWIMTMDYFGRATTQVG
jgi:hypothetical protein